MDVREAAALIAATVLLLAGCSAAPAQEPGTTSPTTVPAVATTPPASVTPLDPAVSVASAGGPGDVISGETDLADGDTVSTDQAGLAELTFADGSFTRLGPASELVVTSLGTVETPRVALRLDVGSTWNRIQRAAAEEPRFEVETPVGVAAVRGTVFAIECADAGGCRFTVYEGELEVTPTGSAPVIVGPLERLHLPGDPADEPRPEPISVDRVLGEAWSADNLARDGDSTVLEAATERNARISGQWTTTFVVQETTNYGMRFVGETFDRGWTLAEGPCDGVRCPTSITSDSGWTGRVRHAGDALVTIPATDLAHCYDIATGAVRVENAFEQHSTYELRVVAAEVIDGVLTATRIEGTNELHLRLLDEHRAACGAEVEDSVELSTVTMVRVS